MRAQLRADLRRLFCGCIIASNKESPSNAACAAERAVVEHNMHFVYLRQAWT